MVSITARFARDTAGFHWAMRPGATHHSAWHSTDAHGRTTANGLSLAHLCDATRETTPCPGKSANGFA